MTPSEQITPAAIVNLLGNTSQFPGTSEMIDYYRSQTSYETTRKKVAEDVVIQIASENPNLDDLSELTRLSFNQILIALGFPIIN